MANGERFIHWKATGGWVLMAVTLAGCSQTFGKGGSMDRALDKDRKALLDTSRTGPIYKKFCEEGRQNTELCRWALANPEEAAAFISEEEE